AGYSLAHPLFDHHTRIGGLKSWEWASWISLGIVGLFFITVVNLLLTGIWSRHLAWILGGLLAFTCGGFVDTLNDAGQSVGRSLRSPEFVQPWWLLCLLVLPCLC